MHTSRIKAMLSMAIIALYGLASPGGDAHHLVRRVNLYEMTVLADRVFVGRCLSVEETEEEIAGGILPVTRYTFEIERAIKGRVSKQIIVKHLGHASRPAKGGGLTMHGRAVSTKTFLHGMNPYKEGDRVMLFLNADSPRGTSPVGLYQGAFFITRMPSGQELAQNSINNLGLFTAPYTGFGVKPDDARVIFPDRDQPIANQKFHSLASRRGALPLDALIELVEEMIAAHGDEKGVITGGQKGGLLK